MAKHSHSLEEILEVSPSYIAHEFPENTEKVQCPICKQWLTLEEWQGFCDITLELVQRLERLGEKL